MVLAIGLLVIGILSRFIPHAPNFTPVLALALFGGAYLRRSHAIFLPLFLMIVSDVFLGLHATIPFTWGSVLVCSLIGLWVRKNRTPVRMLGGAFMSAIFFFMVTNFGSWLAYYPQTAAGLKECYILAVPFFRATLVSTLGYSLVLFGAYEIIARRVKDTALAPVLLQ
ncbi:MAG: hypothetical protein GX606_03445 [Elusimicrobia bacterium]|nr:hypothetical protein [Elusimicrobiota bacterium]